MGESRLRAASHSTRLGVSLRGTTSLSPVPPWLGWELPENSQIANFCPFSSISKEPKRRDRGVEGCVGTPNKSTPAQKPQWGINAIFTPVISATNPPTPFIAVMLPAQKPSSSLEHPRDTSTSFLTGRGTFTAPFFSSLIPIRCLKTPIPAPFPCPRPDLPRTLPAAGGQKEARLC